MLKNFCNGENFYPETKNYLNFQPRSSSCGKNAKFIERNYYDQFRYKFKPINKNPFKKEEIKNQYDYINPNTKDFYSHILKEENENQENHLAKVIELQNFKNGKKKYFSKLSAISNFQNQGQFISKEIFLDTLKDITKEKMIEDKKNEENNYKKILSHTVFLSNSKNNARSQSFHQKNEDENPEWMKPAAMSLALKPLKSLKNKFKDLEIKKFENKKRELLLLPPSPTARYDKKKMAIFYLKNEPRRSKSILKNDIGLSWIEDIQRQKYDKNLTSKIGFSDKPFIKKLELKRNFREKYNKIGQPEIWSGLKSKDLKFYKIGQL